VNVIVDDGSKSPLPAIGVSENGDRTGEALAGVVKHIHANITSNAAAAAAENRPMRARGEAGDVGMVATITSIDVSDLLG